MSVLLFEDYTDILTEYEANILAPEVAKILRGCVGPKNAIRNKTICARLEALGYQKCSEPRMRKIINRIRCASDYVPFLVANSHGYYIATKREEVEIYAESLHNRASAIFEIRSKLLKQLNGRLFL